MKKCAWKKCQNMFLEAFFSHLRKLFSKFPCKIFVIALHEIIGLQNCSLSFCKSKYRITMCNLHWCYTFCTGVKLFALVLYLNFTAVSQSELSNFLVYYYQSVRCIYTSLSIYFHPLLILTNVFFPNHFSGNSQFFEDCYYHSLRFSDSIEVGIAF